MQDLLEVVALGIKGVPPSQFSCDYCLALTPLHRLPHLGRCSVSLLPMYQDSPDEGLIFADLAGIQVHE